MNDHEWMISPAGVLDRRPQVACQKKGSLKFGANGPSFASVGQQQQRSTRSQFDRCPARPVFNRVVKAKVAVLRFWSDSSGSMSQLHLAGSIGRNFSRFQLLVDAVEMVCLLVASRWVLPSQFCKPALFICFWGWWVDVTLNGCCLRPPN